MSSLPCRKQGFLFGLSNDVIEVEVNSDTSIQPTLRDWKYAVLASPKLVEAGVRSVLCIDIVDEAFEEAGKKVPIVDGTVLGAGGKDDEAEKSGDPSTQPDKKAKCVQFRVVVASDPFSHLLERWASMTGSPCQPGLSVSEIDTKVRDLARSSGNYPLHHISLPEPIKRMFLWASEWSWRRYLFRLGGDSDGYESGSEGFAEEHDGWLVFGNYDDSAGGIDCKPEFGSEAGAVWVVNCRADQPTHGAVMYLHEKDEPHFVCSSAEIFAANFERFVGSTMGSIKEKLEAARGAGDPEDDAGVEYKLLSGGARGNPARVFFGRGCPRIDDEAWQKEHGLGC